MWKICLATAVALLAFTPTAEAATSTVSVIGEAEIAIPEPASTFDFRVHASGDGHSGTGVIWLSHHNDTRIGWAVARVDCVRRHGQVAILTGVVGDAQDFAVAGPGDPISLTIRDGAPDMLGFASREQVTRCQGPKPGQPITTGDFRIRH